VILPSTSAASAIVLSYFAYLALQFSEAEEISIVDCFHELVKKEEERQLLGTSLLYMEHTSNDSFSFIIGFCFVIHLLDSLFANS